MNTSHEPQGTVQEPTDIFTYKAAVIDKPGSITFVEIPKAQCKENELLVKMEGVGLCASNIPVWEGREWFTYPMSPGTPGHEGWGTIEQLGALVEDFEIGQRVAVLQGNAFAEYVTVPANDVVIIPPELNGLPFPGEPLGCLMNILERADIYKGQTVAIIGLGFIGLGLVKLCKQKGAKVVALSRRNFSLQSAAHEADLCIRMEDHYQIKDTINEFTGGNGCDRVIECTGKQWPLDLASEII